MFRFEEIVAWREIKKYVEISQQFLSGIVVTQTVTNRQHDTVTGLTQKFIFLPALFSYKGPN